MGQVPPEITDDIQSFINSLPQKSQVAGTRSFFQDGTGRIGVSLEIFSTKQTSGWYYAIIYDKDRKRIKAIKYGYYWYMS